MLVLAQAALGGLTVENSLARGARRGAPRARDAAARAPVRAARAATRERSAGARGIGRPASALRSSPRRWSSRRSSPAATWPGPRRRAPRRPPVHGGAHLACGTEFPTCLGEASAVRDRSDGRRPPDPPRSYVPRRRRGARDGRRRHAARDPLAGVPARRDPAGRPRSCSARSTSGSASTRRSSSPTSTLGTLLWGTVVYATTGAGPGARRGARTDSRRENRGLGQPRMSFESAAETAGRLHPDAEVAGRGADGGHVTARRRRGPSPRRAVAALRAVSLLRDYVALTKPRIISLLLLTTVAAMFVADPSGPADHDDAVDDARRLPRRRRRRGDQPLPRPRARRAHGAHARAARSPAAASSRSTGSSSGSPSARSRCSSSRSPSTRSRRLLSLAGPARLRVRLHAVAQAADAPEHRHRRRRRRRPAARRLGRRDRRPRRSTRCGCSGSSSSGRRPTSGPSRC